MYNRNDPRFRRTLNTISQNLESANESAQISLFSAAEHCLKPCLASLNNAARSCTDACFPTRDQRRARAAGLGRAARGAPELNFDFYDDWEADENDALLFGESDEFDRLLGEGQRVSQPQGRGGMSYGAALGDVTGVGARAKAKRRQSAVLPYDGGPDPTIIPNQSYFGFLSKLPFKIGRKGLRYRPNPEGLQDRPQDRARTRHSSDGEDESGDDSAGGRGGRQHGRKRSLTTGSGHTTDSFSSRGDIFPSDEEDAVPLDDEFAVVLERRTTFQDDTSSGKTKSSNKRPSLTGKESSQMSSSRSVARSVENSRKSSRAASTSQNESPGIIEVPTLHDLKIEDERVQAEEKLQVEKKREAAQRLASQRGLSWADQSYNMPADDKLAELSSPVSPVELNSESDKLTPFPILETATPDQFGPDNETAITDKPQLDQKQDKSTQNEGG